MKQDYFEKQAQLKKDREAGICTNCHKRRASAVPWVGEGGTMAFVHGAYTYWCEFCMTKAQLKNAKELAKRIPILERKLLKHKRKGEMNE